MYFIYLACRPAAFTNQVVASSAPSELVSTVVTEPAFTRLCAAANKFLEARIGLLLRAYCSGSTEVGIALSTVCKY